MDISGDGRFIVAGSANDDTIQLYDYETGEDGPLWDDDLDEGIVAVAISKNTWPTAPVAPTTAILQEFKCVSSVI